jgi:quercetin dioxygenase-like cupin family protein
VMPCLRRAHLHIAMIPPMGEKGYRKATVAELERVAGWSPIRRELGIEAFGVNAWTASDAGAAVIQEHDEDSGHEELYVVVSGHATFTVNGEEIDAPPGTLVFVRDPKAKRAAVAAEAGTTVLVVGAKPGEAFRPMPWEVNADVLPLFGEGRYEEAKQLLLEALEQHEVDQGGLLYNLACAEARLGETDAALEHLAPAFEERPDLREAARADDDLESIRDEPRFAQLVGTG